MTKGSSRMETDRTHRYPGAEKLATECVFTLLRSESLKPAGRDGILSDE